MGLPLMSIKSSASTFGGPSRSKGFPEPLKVRPNMSSDTPNLKELLVNSTVVLCRQLDDLRGGGTAIRTFLTSIPGVPSKTCIY